MPDLGVTKSIAKRAVRDASKEAKVLRPGEEKLRTPVAPQHTVEPLNPADVQAPPVAIDITSPVAAAPQPPAAAKPRPAAAPAAPEPRMPDEIVDTTANRVANAKTVDYSLDQTWQPNFDTIRTTDDVKAVIADRAAANAPKIDAARRGVITHEELRGLADDLDVDQDVIKKVLERETGGVLNPETIVAARQVLNSSAELLKNLANKVVSGQATDIDRLRFRRQVQLHDEFQTQFMGARAEAGRSLNAFGIPLGFDNVNLARTKEVVDSMLGDTDKLAKAISEIPTRKGVTKFVKQYKNSKIFGTLNESFVNSILSGPTTHLVNINGNVLMQGMNTVETALAARIGKFLGTEEGVQVGEASSMLSGQMAGIRDALRLAWRAMKSGKTLDEVSKFDTYQGVKAISADNWLKPEWRDTPLGRVVDGLGAVIRAPTERVMAPTDEFFKTIAYRAELERQAFRHVQEQLDSGAITAAEAEQTARDFLENTPLKAQQAAEDYAKYVTFQNPLGEAGASWQRAIRQVPALGLIAPFIRTPINIFKAGLLDRSPVAFFSKKFYNDLAKGGRTRDMALARVSLGSATAGFIAYQVMQGNVSGAGPRDPDARSLLWAQGWRPYSIKDPATGTWHSYARMEPWASVVGATADAMEIGSYINEDPETLKDEDKLRNDAIAAIVAGIANNTMSKTFMKGMADFSEFTTDPGRYAGQWLPEMATSTVPYSAARRQFGKIMDPYMREAWTLNDKLATASGIPGWSEDAPPRRDLFGEPRKYAQGWLLGTMSPMPDSKDGNDPVLNELVSLMQQTRSVPIAMPGKSIEGMRLNAKEYDDFVRLARAEPIFDGGRKTFKDKVQDLMDSPVYNLATPVYKVELLKNLQFTADRIVSGGLLERENPEFAERIALHRAREARIRFGKE